MDKTPISRLQEYVVSQFKPLPIYQIETKITFGASASFACYCTCDNERVTAEASSKKEAKHRAAALMLQKLGQGSSYTNNNVSTKEKTTIATQAGNSIGALNEYCSKYRHEYPQYNEMGVRAGQFVVTCTHKNNVTEGLASTKKDAKQAAAAAMMAILGDTAITQQGFLDRNIPQNSSNLTPMRPIKKYVDEDIIKTYKQNSIRNHVGSTIKPSIGESFKDPFEMDNLIVRNQSPIATKKVQVDSEKTDKEISLLQEKLKSRNLEYEIEEVDQDACALMLSLRKPRVETFMEIGDTKSDAVLRLLQRLKIRTD